MISLDRVQMNVIQTAENGVVNKDTIFNFTQSGNVVKAEYTGGKVEQGFLIGIVKEDVFEFSYCQLQTDRIMDSGSSVCKMEIGKNGKIRLTENFEWKSRPGEFGINIFEEI